MLSLKISFDIMKKHTKAKKRKLYFRILKKLMRIKYKKPKFEFLGKPFENGAIVLSNHEGTDAPMSLEIYYDAPMRMWGAHEMNSGLISMYKYQSRVYYHQKKHWNLGLARLFCLIASPLTNIFYSGFELISTYRDTRFLKTLKESVNSIAKGDNIIIFPEDSTKSYLSELEGFHAGFILLAEKCLRQGIDAPIYVSYYRKSDNAYIFDKPVYYSELLKSGQTKEQIADELRLRCNELGKMNFDKE